MHELSLAEAMLDIIKEQAKQEGFSRVTKVVLEIGALSHVEADAMTFCFDAVVEDSVAKHAILEIQRTPAKAQCPECQHIDTIQNLYDACHQCGSFGLKVLEGDQLRILKLEVE
jgi:hydrogenase nickel incorporation protein HypA/HybF